MGTVAPRRWATREGGADVAGFVHDLGVGEAERRQTGCRVPLVAPAALRLRPGVRWGT